MRQRPARLCERLPALAALDILIVDDHEPMRVLLTRVLERVGASRVRTAASSAEALALLLERPADLILADQRMPGADGLSFIAGVRAKPALGAPKIIMLSGATGHFDAAREAGADAVLAKPVTPSELLTAIQSVLAG